MPIGIKQIFEWLTPINVALRQKILTRDKSFEDGLRKIIREELKLAGLL